MPFRSVAERRAALLADPEYRALLRARPELASVIDAYLWAYPRSRPESRRTLVILLIALGSLAGMVALCRARRS